jgi:hypothetical protein
MKKVALLVAVSLLTAPPLACAQSATSTTGSQSCAKLAQAAADGMSARIQADDQNITPPASVSRLSCLNNFFNGIGLNLITNLINPASILQAVEGQICSTLNAAWQQTLGSANCGLTLTGFNLNFGGLGGGELCPRLSFGGGGPPLGSVGTSATNGQSNGYGLYMNSMPTTPSGYPVSAPGGLF